MPRIVIDTDTFISVLLCAGQPEAIIKLVAVGKATLYTSYGITAEEASGLKNRFSWTNQQVEYPGQFRRDISVLVTPAGLSDIVKTDDADHQFLECAHQYQADYIVTGDR